MERITCVNMTNFFSREMFMYSMGDIKFKKPISLKKIAYTLLFIICFTLPMVLMFGIQMNPYYMMFILGIPFILGNLAVKPIFGGKTLIPFVKCMLGWIREPKGWTDLKNNNDMGVHTYYVYKEIWISRRRELRLLAEMKAERKRSRRAGRKNRRAAAA